MQKRVVLIIPRSLFPKYSEPLKHADTSDYSTPSRCIPSSKACKVSYKAREQGGLDNKGRVYALIVEHSLKESSKASIPTISSPSLSKWRLGPLPIFSALVLGVLVPIRHYLDHQYSFWKKSYSHLQWAAELASWSCIRFPSLSIPL